MKSALPALAALVLYGMAGPAPAQQPTMEDLVRNLTEAASAQSQAARGAGERTLNLRRDVDGCPGRLLATLNGRRLADDAEAHRRASDTVRWIDGQIASTESYLQREVRNLEIARCKLALAAPRTVIVPSQRLSMEQDLRLLPQLIVDAQNLVWRLREVREEITAGGEVPAAAKQREATVDALRRDTLLWSGRQLELSRERNRLLELARHERQPLLIPAQTLP